MLLKAGTHGVNKLVRFPAPHSTGNTLIQILTSLLRQQLLPVTSIVTIVSSLYDCSKALINNVIFFRAGEREAVLQYLRCHKPSCVSTACLVETWKVRFGHPRAVNEG